MAGAYSCKEDTVGNITIIDNQNPERTAFLQGEDAEPLSRQLDHIADLWSIINLTGRNTTCHESYEAHQDELLQPYMAAVTQ